MMNRRGHNLIWAFAFAALMVSSLASARMFFEEEGIEASTSDVRLPASSDGYLVIRACDDCDEITLKVSDKTQCTVNGERIAYREMQRLARTPANGLYIFYNPESKDVTRLTLNGSFPLGSNAPGNQRRQDNGSDSDRDHEVADK